MAASAPLQETPRRVDLRNLARVHGEAVEGGVAATWVSVDALLPWAENPRFNDDAHVSQVVASIQRFGFGAPVIGNARTGELVAGHTRILAAKQLAMSVVPMRMLDLDPEQAELLALADNRLTETGRWNDQTLATILRRHSEKDRVGLLVAGFDEHHIVDILRRTFDPGAVEPVGGWPEMHGQLTHAITFYFTADEKAAVLEAVETAVAASGKTGTAVRGSVLADMARAWMAARPR